jgi:hypothetical protein
MAFEFNPDYLSKPESEKPELLPGECDTFDAAQRVFDKIYSEYRVALGITDDDGEYRGSDPARNLHISKTGGMPLFPKAMRWPLCRCCGEEMFLKYQIRKQDAPALPTPKGNDMLLLFMCPEDCGEEEPEHAIVWLKESDVTDPFREQRGRKTEAHVISFRQFRDHMQCTEYNHDGYPFYDSQLSSCLVRHDVRTVARLMEGIADDSLDEHLARYGDHPLAQLENMDNEALPFFESMEIAHFSHEKVGGYPSWVQNANLCHGSLMNILQIEWAEGFWHIVVCPECGEFFTEYQGT